MHDNFKKYAEQNAEAFDHTFDVDKGLQDLIQRQDQRKKPRRVFMAAASITIALALSAVVYFYAQPAEEISEWAEVEHYYERQIEDMTQLVMNLTNDEDILYDLEELDQAFAEVKADLKDDAANQEVIEAMMNHYRLKLSILEKMLDEIKESNEDENISKL